MPTSTSQASIVLPQLDAPSAAVRIDALFDRALRARHAQTGAGAGNLYGGSAGPDAMLAAFRLLIDGTPLIRFGHLGANTVIDSLTLHADAIHIVDIGIGHGAQWDDLLARLATRSSRPRVRLTGIDLPSPGSSPSEALERTGARLAALAADLGIAFTFEAVAGAIEQIERPASLPGERMIVNAALALHHVADGDAVTDPALGRRALLRRLADWKPALLTLIEPDANHNELAFADRLREARRHYGLVFDVFAHLFPHDPAERTTLERHFFGNEILNVVASEGAARVERHDRIETWCRKLVEAGFEPLSLGALTSSHARALGLRAPFTVERRGPAMALCFEGESLLGVSAWTPATASIKQLTANAPR
jgi:hypothetical protein